jgi:hypothetical protein
MQKADYDIERLLLEAPDIADKIGAKGVLVLGYCLCLKASGIELNIPRVISYPAYYDIRRNTLRILQKRAGF